VNRELERQARDLPSRDIISRALENGFSVVVEDLEQGIGVCEDLAPEHLGLFLEVPEAAVPRLSSYGTLFVGASAAEVLGDYGAGPNHVLPTGGSARFSAGLSVYTFLKARTWLRIDDPAQARELAGDAVSLARLEGLEAHARAALRRGSQSSSSWIRSWYSSGVKKPFSIQRR
jgi:phosphoribosyl-ATP pyrophosphohydrolase/phosphoribosyl-AMP cyclohydrolase/histidinol dehydrogenase